MVSMYRHLEISDEGGQFVARSNLGLCYGLLGDTVSATTHHQEALRIAITLKVIHRLKFSFTFSFAINDQ